MKQLAVNPVGNVVLFGYSDGVIKRLCEPDHAHLIMVKKPDGVGIEQVWWQLEPRPWWAFWRKNHWLAFARNVDGGVWQSNDDGLTWA